MSDSRTLPISAEHREFTIKVNGETVSREHQLTGVTVSASVNKIASARLSYLDGAAATGSFALADSLIFAPGQQVEILAGAGNDSTSIFIGQVVKIGLRIRDNSAPQYLVDCRHIAMKLTATERNADFFDQTDSDIMSAILSAAGLDADIESTTTTHEQVLQFQATDWDFLLARARANGQQVWCEDERIVARKPTLSEPPVCTLNFGATLIEFEGEIDARTQHTTVECESWNPADQASSSITGSTPAFTPPGQLTSTRLAEVTNQPRKLQHPTLPEQEAQAWVDARSLAERVDQVQGRGKCEGIATVKPGQTIELLGLGQCFNGKVFVSGVRHEFSLVQGWKTHIQFGGVHSETPSAPAFSALVPPIGGLQIGVVTSNEDPSGEYRIRVRLPSLGLASDGIWARIASLDAGNDRGFFFRPEIGDEVTVGFLGEDPRHPVILGMLHSSAHPAPENGSDDNHHKLYQSRAGMKVHIDDEKTTMTLSTPGGNRVVLDEDQQSLSLLDQNGNKLVMNADGILIESAAKLDIKASADANMEGINVSIKASAEIKLEGSASAELKGGGTTKVSGALVQIN